MQAKKDESICTRLSLKWRDFGNHQEAAESTGMGDGSADLVEQSNANLQETMTRTLDAITVSVDSNGEMSD